MPRGCGRVTGDWKAHVHCLGMKSLRKRIIAILSLPLLRPVAVLILRGVVYLHIGFRHRYTPFTVMIVGGRGGLDPYTKWLRRCRIVHAIGVEPESSGLEALQKTKAYDTIVHQGLAETQKKATLYITKARGWCSLLRPDETAIKRVASPICLSARPFEIVKTETIDLTTLDTIMPTLPQIDFLQIDVQGAELQVLKGAKESLKNIAMIELEVRFYPIYEDEPSWNDLHTFLQENGFLLVHMTRQGEREFGTTFVEANACYVHASTTRDRERMATLHAYAKAKHDFYTHRFLRLLADLDCSSH